MRSAVVAAVLLLAACRCSAENVKGFPFWVRSETADKWLDYYSPYGQNGVYFQPKRHTVQDLEMFICSGMGRTGTSSVGTMMRRSDVQHVHEHTPFTLLPMLSATRDGVADMINVTRWLEVHNNRHRLAPLDNPVGVFAWDLMSAFPRHHVLHAVRPADAWEASLRKLVAAFNWPVTPVNEATFHTGTRAAEGRVALRRFFELNSMIITTVPEDHLTLVDVTAEGPMDSFNRVLNTSIKNVPHTHDSHSAMVVRVTPALHDTAKHTGVELDGASNPQGLNLFATMTPVPIDGLPPPTSHFFAPGRKTSPHPLVIGAGFDGTGLDVLTEMFMKLGLTNVRNPVVDLQAGIPRGVTPCDPLHNTPLYALHKFGLQSDMVPPSRFHGVDLVVGQPAPLLVWDFLEAFPNAKVILTVRQMDEWYDVVKVATQGRGFPSVGSANNIMSTMVWGAGRTMSHDLNKPRAVRRLLTHNNAIIHGVPKKQLLVWDPFKDPRWEPLCNFLKVPVPKIPFPPLKDAPL